MASSKKQTIEVDSWPTIGSLEIGMLQILNYEFSQIILQELVFNVMGNECILALKMAL